MTDHLETLRKRFKIADSEKVGSLESIPADSVNTETREITCIATASQLDLDDEVILAEGGDFSYIRAVKSVFKDHKYDIEDFVGRIRRIDPIREGSEIVAWKIRFHCTRNALGDEILRQAAEDGIFVSIGFKHLAWGPPTPEQQKRWPNAVNIIDRWLMLELSVTHIPANKWAAQVDGPPPITIGKTATLTVFDDDDAVIVERGDEVDIIFMDTKTLCIS